jgi:hypothetical protein
METPAYLPFLLIIFSVLSGITGIVLFIMGLVKGKIKMWNTGLLFIAAGIMVWILNFNKGVSVLSDNADRSTDTTTSENKHNNYVFSDSTTYSDRPVDSSYAEPISGMVEDKDFKKVYIKVFPSRELKGSGLVLEDIEKGKHKKDVSQSIAAVFSSEKEFSGKLTIFAFDYEKKLLGKSTAKLKCIMGDRATVNFPFSESTDFSIIDYCTLGFEE